MRSIPVLPSFLPEIVIAAASADFVHLTVPRADCPVGVLFQGSSNGAPWTVVQWAIPCILLVEFACGYRTIVYAVLEGRWGRLFF